MSSNLFKLDPEDYEIQPDELLVIAIHSTGVPFYKLAHFLNRHLEWNLINIKDAYQPPENPSCSLNVLSHVDELFRVQYLLVENLSGQQFWIPKMPDVDYWIIVTGAGLNESRVDVDRLKESLSDTPSVFSASILPFDNPFGKGRVSPLFKYFQSLYDFLDYKDIIRRFD